MDNNDEHEGEVLGPEPTDREIGRQSLDTLRSMARVMGIPDVFAFVDAPESTGEVYDQEPEQMLLTRLDIKGKRINVPSGVLCEHDAIEPYDYPSLAAPRSFVYEPGRTIEHEPDVNAIEHKPE